MANFEDIKTEWQAWLRSQGVESWSDLTAERRQELWEKYRDERVDTWRQQHELDHARF